MPDYKHLQPDERDQIATLHAQGLGPTAISKAIGRCKSTISRELRHNALGSGAYRPIHAEGSYRFRWARPARLDRDDALRAYVLARLAEGWSPEQIAGRLRLGLEKQLTTLSTETIYSWIYAPMRAAEKLWQLLTCKRPKRGRRAPRSKDKIAEKAHISERSEAADARESYE